MSEIAKTLSNLNSLRGLARETELSQLEAMLAKFTQVVEEKRERVAQEMAKQAERLAKIKEYKALLAQEGISLEDLADNTKENTKRKREPLPAKYQYTDANGETKTWTGQGRIPKAIQTAIDGGKSLKDFEI